MSMRDHVPYDEEILWEGRPSKKSSILGAIFNPFLFVMLAWIAMAVLLYVIFLNGGTFENISSARTIVYKVFGVVFMLPTLLYPARLIELILIFIHTEYAITSRAVYCRTGSTSVSTVVKHFSDITNISVEQPSMERLCETCDIILTDRPPEMHGIRIITHQLVMPNVENYGQVIKMIKDLMEGENKAKFANSTHFSGYDKPLTDEDAAAEDPFSNFGKTDANDDERAVNSKVVANDNEMAANDNVSTNNTAPNNTKPAANSNAAANNAKPVTNSKFKLKQ